MGLGFPLRPSRSSFGPEMADRVPIKNPRQQVPASAINALFWQVAGCGLLVPLARVVVTDINAVAVAAHWEAWNPDGSLGAPTVERINTGDYAVTYASSYLDEDGASRAVSWSWVRVAPLIVPGAASTKLVGMGEIQTNGTLEAYLFAVSGGSSANGCFVVEAG